MAPPPSESAVEAAPWRRQSTFSLHSERRRRKRCPQCWSSISDIADATRLTSDSLLTFLLHSPHPAFVRVIEDTAPRTWRREMHRDCWRTRGTSARSRLPIQLIEGSSSIIPHSSTAGNQKPCTNRRFRRFAFSRGFAGRQPTRLFSYTAK
jgi:hypothetical protein